MVARVHTTLQERFDQKYMPEPMSGCWLWVGCGMGAGYGSIWDPDRGEKIGAHVASYRLHCGEIPDGLVVRHRCDVRCCVNPEHLELGSRLDNQSDMVVRGRSTRGTKNPMARLSPADVQTIRRRLAAGELQRSIADAFDINQSLVSQIATKKVWSHVHD